MENSELLKAYKKSEKQVLKLQEKLEEQEEAYNKRGLQVEEYIRMARRKEQRINDANRKLGEERKKARISKGN